MKCHSCGGKMKYEGESASFYPAKIYSCESCGRPDKDTEERVNWYRRIMKDSQRKN